MTQPPSVSRLRGFSLVELLCVIAVIALMMALIAPAISGLSGTSGRRGAVNIVMNTLEQARVAALESGQTVYVGFADGSFPVEEMRFAAFLVFRDATEEEKAAQSGRQYVVLKPWTKLPRNVAFKDLDKSLMGHEGSFDGLERELPQTKNSKAFPFIAFNSSGAVDQPGSNLLIFLTEAITRGNDQQELGTRGDLFEKISISRYTGRAHLDVTATGS